jgi:hypothetical protein
MRLLQTIAVLGLAWAALAAPASAAAGRQLLGVRCQTPAPLRCAPGGCTAAELADTGNAVDPGTGRKFFLDYPCDLKPGDKVVFILLLHGAGSTGEWVRHYFPAMDYKDRHRLVVATPTAAGGGPTPVRMWLADNDDVYLHDISDLVIGAVGRRNIRSFWLAGHSQGGLTVNRIVCDSYFRDKVDGWLSLSGGRIGSAPLNPEFFKGLSIGSFPPGAGPPGGAPGVAVTPACDINFIFATGEHEILALPQGSPWADRYACEPKRREPDVVDDKPGLVDNASKSSGPPNLAQGTHARPGTAEVFVYPNCRGGRLVADVLRLDKGHTEGLEPRITEKLIQMMVAAPGGKLQRN